VKYYFCQRGRDPALITEPVWTFQLLIAYGMGRTEKWQDVGFLCSAIWRLVILDIVYWNSSK
jgi:hypothetical protein